MKVIEKIYLVDDDEEDIGFLAEAFKVNGLEVDLKSFLGGLELITFIQSGKFNEKDLPGYIIIDLNMPVINGLETVKYIREHNSFSEIPIIMLSTSSLSHSIEEAYKAGVDTYIEKPNSFNKLVKVVNHLNSWAIRKIR